MNLNQLAESDLQFTLEDNVNGFGVALVFLDSEGEEQEIICNTTDIGYFIDPSTGEGVNARTIEIVGRIVTFESKSVTPVKGSTVKYYDTLENEYIAIVKNDPIPDRKLGLYKILLGKKAAS